MLKDYSDVINALEKKGIHSGEINLPEIIEDALEDQYKNNVEYFVKNDINGFIPNSTIFHAVFLTKIMLERCKGNIKVYTGKLSELFYRQPQIRAALLNVLNKNRRIEIILQEIPALPIDPGIEEIINHNNTSVRSLNAGYNPPKLNINGYDDINHFIVIGGKSYRVERFHLSGEISYVKAFVNFNDVDTSKLLNDRFKELHINSVEYQL